LLQSNYSSALETVRDLKKKYGETWNAINPESAARMATQNRFKTGLDIARYTAAIMRKIWQRTMQIHLNIHNH
jgi:isocitrate lyase